MTTVNGTIKMIMRSAMLLLAVLTTTTMAAWEQQPPIYCVDLCKGGLGEVCVSGWAYDAYHGDLDIIIIASTKPNKNDEDYEEEIASTLSADAPDVYNGYPIERVYREDVNARYNLIGDFGFRAKIPIMASDFDSADELTIYVKIYARTSDYNEFNKHQYQLNGTYTVNVRKNTGEGTERIPYVICNAADWDVMADPELAPFYSGSNFRLANTEDDGIDYDNSACATKTFGTSTYPFTGYFDGKGQTLNVNISSDTESFVAPFAYTNGATIENLTVAGSINAVRFSGGIVGFAKGTLNLRNCVCSATISGFPIFAGGLLGICEDLHLNIQDCLFKGSFSPGNGGKYHPIACKTSYATVKTDIVKALYLNTVTPSEGMNDYRIKGAEGTPVNSTYNVNGSWTMPIAAADGIVYHAKQGELDYSYALSDGVLVKGWSFDPDVPSESASVKVCIYTDAACEQQLKEVQLCANYSRPEVNAANGITGCHGFYAQIPISDAGTYYVKVMALDMTSGADLQIGATQSVAITQEPLSFVKDAMISLLAISDLPDEYKTNDWIRSRSLGPDGVRIDYQTGSSNGLNNNFITDFYLSNAPNPVPGKLTYNGRTYRLLPVVVKRSGPSLPPLEQSNGDLHYRDGEGPLHVYYTRDVFDDNRVVTGITFDDNNNGALGLNGSTVPYSLTTGMKRQTDYFGQEFEDYPPRFMHLTTATTPWHAIAPPYSYSFQKSLDEDRWMTVDCANETGIKEEQFQFKTSSRPQYLISPLFDTDTPMKMTFNAYSKTKSTCFYVGWSQTNKEVSEFIWKEAVIGENLQQLEYEIPLGTKYVAIKAVEDVFYVDDICFESTSFIAPAQLNLSNLSVKTATFSWSAPQTDSKIIGYSYQYKKAVDTNWSEAVTTTDTSATITDLDDNTSYHFRVKTLYVSAESLYEMTDFISFNYPPTQLDLIQLTEQTATISWTAPETESNILGYRYQYKKATDADWSEVFETTATSATLSSLDINTRYHFRVKTVCGNYESLYATKEFTSFVKIFLPYTYDFSHSLEYEGWTIKDSQYRTGTYSASFNFHLYDDIPRHPQYLISPLIVSETPVAVAFNYTISHWYHEAEFQLGYSTTNNEITAFTWLPKVFYEYYKGPRPQYENIVPKGTKYIAIKAVLSKGNNCDFIVDNMSLTACDVPTPVNVALNDCQDHTAQLSWTAPQADKTITGYGYQYKKAGDSNWSDETTAAADATIANLSHLTADTDYNFRIRTLYANDEKSAYINLSFITAKELPFNDGFENGLGRWTVVNGNNTFVVGTRFFTGPSERAVRDGAYGFRFNHRSVDAGPQYLVSPLLPTGDKKLSFYYRCGGMGYDEEFQVGYSTTSTDPSTFTWYEKVITREFENWTKYDKNLPANARYFAIKYIETYNDSFNMYFDDFCLEAYSDKAMPTDLKATDLIDQLATKLNWSAPNASVTGYAYQYKKATEDSWSDLTTTTATTVTLSGLTVNTDYQFRVKALYAGGSSSYFATVFFVSNGGIEKLPYEWGFESGLGGFRVVDNVHDTEVVDFTWHKGAHAFRFSPTNGSLSQSQDTPQYLISPQFDGRFSKKVSFYYRMSDDEKLYLPAAFQIGYSTTTNAISAFQWLENENVSEMGWRQYECNLPEGTKFMAIKWLPEGYFIMLDDFRFEGTTNISLSDIADNTETISQMDGFENCSVLFNGRTLYRDGDWNTLFLPFALNSFSGSPLDGFVAKELDIENAYSGHMTGLDDGTLHLNFRDVTTIAPGRPYIVKYVRVAGADASLITYQANRGSQSDFGEDYYNLVDGDMRTKWCTKQLRKENGRWFCDFTTSNPINVTGYTFIPGTDMLNNPDRAPMVWTLKAKVSFNDDWTTIDERDVNKNGGDAMSTYDFSPTSYSIASDKQGSYQYFRLEVYETGGGLLQLGEMTLQGTIAPGGVTDITDPVFTGVTVNATAPTEVSFTGGKFVGTYKPIEWTDENKSILFLGSGNTLYWPQPAHSDPNDDTSAMVYPSIGAFRAYFDLGSNTAREFKLNFGDDPSTQGDNFGDDSEASGITTTDYTDYTDLINSDEWYSLDGRKLSGKPTKKGIYVNRGRKVAIK